MAVVAQRHIDATTCNADNVLRTPRVWHIQVEAVHNEDLHVTAAQLCFYNFLSIFSTTLHPDIMATATLPPASDAATSSSSIAAASSSSAEVFKRLHPASYLARFLTKGYRPDGRKLRGWRDVSVNVGECGAALEEEPCTEISLVCRPNELILPGRINIHREWLCACSFRRDHHGLRNQGRGSRAQLGTTSGRIHRWVNCYTPRNAVTGHRVTARGAGS
jgi:hypothetical protein